MDPQLHNTGRRGGGGMGKRGGGGGGTEKNPTISIIQFPQGWRFNLDTLTR